MPTRSCVGCRATDEQAKLVRLVLDPSGRVKVDRKRQLAGRGGYVHDQRSCVERAVQAGGLARSFRRKTQTVNAEQLIEKLWRELSGTEEEGT
jgi:predicted RNA-binding protein YlxR (DUF448 family)